MGNTGTGSQGKPRRGQPGFGPVGPQPLQHRTLWQALFLLSAATLAFEIDLTRLLSVAQFYHFSFMIVSIALLGFGASGTALTIFPALQKSDPRKFLGRLALATGISILLAFALANSLPFDSFSVAWDRRQLWILLLHYVLLASPFFFSGTALGFLLNAWPRSAGTTYAANLFGAAAGCLVALAGPLYVGAEGVVTLSSALAAAAAIVASLPVQAPRKPLILAALGLFVFSVLDLSLRLALGHSFAPLDLDLSPYKSLSYVLRYPDSRVVSRRWNAYSRVDVVRSGGLHSLPGLSYRYLQLPPALDALLVDGDDLSPIVGPNTEPAFAPFMPDAAAFYLRPQGNALVLEPRGGLDVLTALNLTSGSVSAVEVNPLIVQAVPVYTDPRLQLFVESERSYLRRARATYDVIVLSLVSSFHPVRSGAYTLSEDYRYTVESFRDALAHLTPGGLFIATRWLQDPPSEDLRLFALAVTALENDGADPAAQIFAFRGFNTATILLKNGAFSAQELSSLRIFLADRAFDLSYAPDVAAGETNRYNILPQSEYYQTYVKLLKSNPRAEFYAAYAYDVHPPTDDRPFFAHYFKWTQTPQILAELGTAWLPFGGAGYFLILALLIMAILFAGVLIILPVAVRKRPLQDSRSRSPVRQLIYFGLLGLAFMFVELPLLQGFILYLGQPAYAVAFVLCSLLLFSGIGSRYSPHIPLRLALPTLAVLIVALPPALRRLFDVTLGLPLPLRFGVTALALAPVGFLMGVPFPSAIRLTESEQPASHYSQPLEGSIPWVWAVNGAASVVSSILAALLALTFGFSWVLRLGAACYGLAALTAWRWADRPRPVPRFP